VLEIPTLTGGHLVLVPLTPDAASGLLAAANRSRDTYELTRVPATPDQAREYIGFALAEHAAGRMAPFAITRADTGEVLGSTRFLDLEYWRVVPEATDPGRPSVAEIGYTWLAESAQGTTVNPEMKLLMLTHAFEVWGCYRVHLKTDARNARSRRGIEKLGARFEGIRRAHVLATDGGLRDSAYYSILAAEWPEVRSGLLDRLRRATADQPN
jgi:N-acetyltransferase